MKKLILLFAVGFFAGMGGGTAWVVTNAKSIHAAQVAELAAAEAGAAGGDSIAVGGDPEEAAGDTTAVDTVRHGVDDVGAPDVQPITSPPVARVAVDEEETVPVTNPEGPKRLAQIISAMQARDAARVLQELNDSEIEAILFHLSDRTAAQILSSFEPSRAAELSRAVMHAGGETE